MFFCMTNTATGRVLYGGSSDSPELLANPGETVILDVQHTAGYFDQGVHYLEGERPSIFHQFDYVTKQWVDPRTLQQCRDTQWEAMKDARNVVIYSPLLTPYGVFDADPKSKTNITDAISLLQTLAAVEEYPSISFTLADNSVVAMGVTELVNVGILMGQRVQAAHGISRTLRTQIDAASTISEVQAISWPV